MPRAFLNWLADAGRFILGLFYWNSRKTLYGWQGRRGRNPCQNPSDHQVPGRMRCDAAMHWHEVARFRKLCPLLVATPEGWRCSAPAGQVRPFWGRAAVWCAALGCCTYLLGVTAVWSGLRIAGRAPVGWATVAWPGRWADIPRAQATSLLDQAMAAFRQGRLAEAQLALGTARGRDPGNYEVALLLAQIAMFERSYLFADEQFMQLWRDHPDQRLRTAITCHDTLLALDRMAKLAEFSTGMAAMDRTRAVVWVRSVLLAVRAMPAAEAAAFREKQADAIARLAPHAQLLLQAEFDLRAGREAAALATLRRPFGGLFNPFYAQYQIKRLAELGAVGDARVLLGALGPLMGEFDHQLTQAAVGLMTKDATLVQGATRAILRLPLNNPRIERLAGLLIRHPDAELYRGLHARLMADPAFVQTVDGAGLWITGIVCGLPEEAGFWQRHGRQQGMAVYPGVTAVDFSSRDLMAPASPARLVNLVTFPREVILALLWRVPPQVERRTTVPN